MSDPVLRAFLLQQLEEGLALASESDLVAIAPLASPDGGLPDRYVVRFTCQGLVRTPGGSIVEANEFAVGISFQEDHLRRVVPFQVVTWLHPRNIWHPNVSDVAPVICVGHLAPGTGLVDLIYQCFEIITWNKVTMREDDALNRHACQWARANLARLPVDTRPLKRRPLAFGVAELAPGASHASS